MLFLDSLRIFQHSFWGRRQLKIPVLLPWSVEPKKYVRGSRDYNPSLQ